jgi:hypothetical protein
LAGVKDDTIDSHSPTNDAEEHLTEDANQEQETNISPRQTEKEEENKLSYTSTTKKSKRLTSGRLRLAILSDAEMQAILNVLFTENEQHVQIKIFQATGIHLGSRIIHARDNKIKKVTNFRPKLCFYCQSLNCLQCDYVEIRINPNAATEVGCVERVFEVAPQTPEAESRVILHLTIFDFGTALHPTTLLPYGKASSERYVEVGTGKAQLLRQVSVVPDFSDRSGQQHFLNVYATGEILWSRV